MEYIQQVTQRLDVTFAMVNEEVSGAGTRWTDDPMGCARRELAEQRPSTPPQVRPWIPDSRQPALTALDAAAPSASPQPVIFKR